MITEHLVPGPARGLAALLDVPCPDLDAGEPLPLGWHWLYLLDRPRQGDLGEDGHPVRGVFPSPPEPGLRRMWAGGELVSLGALRTGEEATRSSRVLRTETKNGRSGPLTFVSVEHTVGQRGEPVVLERQDILYRRPDSRPASDVPAGAEQPPGEGERSIPIGPALLFRFSALTYNGHRIHYDRDYARDVEGYPGLVTHGPLQALAMAEAARAAGLLRPGAPATFSYRLVAPLYEHQGLIVRADADGSTVVRDRFGRRTAQGSVGPRARP